MVFNTSMTGYQEVLTDPSYAGQIVCMTYPLIGNYGVNESDAESARPWVEGFVVREASRITSSWRAEESLESYLKRWNIVAIEGIDTRALVRHIRDKGAMRACLSTIDLDDSSVVEKARQSPSMENRELASVVTTKEPYDFPAAGEERFHVVCYDFGVKRNSLRELAQLGVRTTVVPASTSAAGRGASRTIAGRPSSRSSNCTNLFTSSLRWLPMFSNRGGIAPAGGRSRQPMTPATMSSM